MSTMLASQSPPMAPTPEDSRSLLRALSHAIGLAQEYEISLGKRVLWKILMGLVAGCSDFYEQCVDQHLLSPSVKVLHCAHGIVLATLRDFQLTLNVFVPRSDDDTRALYDWMVTLLKRDFFDYAIDLRPILAFVDSPPPHVQYRSMLPSPRRMPDLVLDLERRIVVFQEYASPVVEIITDYQRLSRYRPVTRMISSDDPTTVYWHRFDCGTIAAFQNPRVELHESIRVPRVDPCPLECLTPLCRRVVRALEPRCAPECLDVVEMKCVTVEVRRVFVAIHKSRFGISDELILTVGMHLGDATSKETKNLMLAELCIVHEMMHRFSTETATPLAHARLLEGLMNWLDRFQEVSCWRAWILTSAFMHALVSSVATSSMRRVGARYPILYHLMAATLCTQHPDPIAWDRDVTERAHLVCEAEEQSPENESAESFVRTLRNLYGEWSRVNQQAYASLADCAETEDSSLSPLRLNASKPRSETWCDVSLGDADDVAPPVGVPSRTHDKTIARIASEVLQDRFECTLIGSGIFYDGGDVDIVVHVPNADTLEDAYDTVQTLSGWTRHYDRVSTEHITVLRGEFCGLKVDAQVWRGVHALDRTRAEQETHRALTLTRTLRDETDDRLRRLVHEFHVYATRIGFKGHVLCRLPGVAVTCMAISVARVGTVTSLGPMLETVRQRLEVDIPCFDLEGDGDRRSSEPRERPTCAVQVVLAEVNVASRMTACTTRHLLDTVAWSLRDDGVGSPRMWRVHHMITCLRMRPRDAYERTVALTLHASLCKMDGHPLVETAYVDEHPETEDVIVRVTLRRDARYGFRGTETLSRVAMIDSLVMVSRGDGTRQWALCTHPCAHATSIAPSVSDVGDEMFVRVDSELCVPNAPHLMSDLLGYFDPRHWTRVDV